MTQRQVATEAQISQGQLSKAESGLLVLDEGRLAAVASSLRVPVSTLNRSAGLESVLSACAFHRKRSTLSVSDAKRVRALLDLLRLQMEPVVEGWLPTLRLPRMSPSSDDTVNELDIARQVRSTFTSTSGPLTGLVAQIEGDGVLVVARPLGSARVDALGSWPAGRRPMFLLNDAAPADRARFTLAHELGHAVMHEVPVDGQERQADRFASELLMPARDIRDELRGLTLPRLVELKRRWMVSMAALLRRGRDLGAIRDGEYRRLNIELSTAGYRTREPVDLAAERPALVAEAVRARLGEGQSVAQLAGLAGVLEDEFVEQYASNLVSRNEG
jgi:Zn-dependent peptidase ImmA (M78 family)/transcriptional regulator with XRE-family HTH domain